MPSKNVIRYYAENSFFHIYNRGVEKRLIFVDDQDYKTFLYYLFVYLAPPETIKKIYPHLNTNLAKNNLYGKVNLHAYCLMPNHFHLLTEQLALTGTTKLMRQLSSAYTHYFNDKYDRVGSLFQGKFKAAGIHNEESLLQVSRYIHQNPLKLAGYHSLIDLINYPWSSFSEYTTSPTRFFLTTDLISSYFSQRNQHLSYRSFVERDLCTDLSEDLTLESS